MHSRQSVLSCLKARVLSRIRPGRAHNESDCWEIHEQDEKCSLWDWFWAAEHTVTFRCSHFTHTSALSLVNVVFCLLTLLNHWIEYLAVEGHDIQEYLPSTECLLRAKSFKHIISISIQVGIHTCISFHQ